MYCAYITTIKELRKHSNADRLQCATIFGNNVIVDLSFKAGQRVVYFPVDGQLSEEFAAENNLIRIRNEDGTESGGYLDSKKRNIKAIRLRGEQSDGLILPIESLKKYTDVSSLSDGDQITVLNGHEICRKYIPQNDHYNKKEHDYPLVKNKDKKHAEVYYPFFEQHKDTEQLAYNQEAFRPGDTIYLTQKLHGTSFRVSNSIKVTRKKRPKVFKKVFRLKDKEIKEYELISGSRRQILSDFNGGFYGDDSFREKYLQMFEGKLPKGMTVYGEIVGWIDDDTPIMPRCKNSKLKDEEFSKKYGEETIFTYGCEQGENDCYVYRITMHNEDGVMVELPTEETQLWCERLGVKYVPLLDKFIYTTWEDLNKRCEPYLDVPEPLAHGSHVTEGVVVRIDNRGSFTAYKTKSFAFKVLEGIIKESADVPDREEAEEISADESCLV